MIINRYLVRELSRPLVAILGILVALFGSYTAAGFLSDAVDGLLPAGAIAELIGLKLLISLEVLIPAALYASVLLAFARLSGESEFAAMYSIRMTPGTLVRAVLTLAGALAAVVAVLSLVVRPLAYRTLHAVSDRAATLLDIDAMEAGSFYVAEGGGRVIFLGHRPGRGATARDVFVRIRHADRTEIVHARLADELRTKTLARGADIYLTDAHVYEIDRSRGRPDQVVEARGLVVSPNPGHGAARGYSAVAAGSWRLAGSRDDADIAELQWRLSTPVSTLLLALLAIPLSRTAPRQGRLLPAGPGDPGLFRLLPALHLGAYLGAARRHRPVPRDLVGAGAAGAAVRGHDVSAPPRPGAAAAERVSHTGAMVRAAVAGSLRRYVALSVARSFAVVALALTGLFSLLEFVEQLASVGEGHYHVANALLFVLLTAPSRLLQVTPVSMLLGCLFAMGALGRQSELVAMLSLGLSERRIVGSALWPALAAIAALLLLMEFVIPPAEQLAREQRDAALSTATGDGGDSGFWAQRGGEYLNVQRFARGDVPIGIDIYSFEADGSLDSIVHAGPGQHPAGRHLAAERGDAAAGA